MLTPEEEAHKARLLQELKELEDGARARWLQQSRERKYSFADIVNAEYLAEAKQFQKIFGRYIPDLLEDEHATIRLHQRIKDGLFTNPAETYSKPTFEADIKRFRNAITTLSELSVWGTNQCIAIVPRNAETHDDGDIIHAAREIYDCILLIGDARDHYETLPQILDTLESWARKAIEYIPDRRNINWQAVHAVNVLHRFWESWTETQAPRRALNPASPFAAYLHDAFEFFEITGDPIAAFKRWVALEESDPDKWK